MIFDVLEPIAFALVRFSGLCADTLLFGFLPLLLLVLRPSFADLDDALWGQGRGRVARRLEGIVGAMLVASFTATLLAILLQAVLAADITGGDVGGDSFSSVLATSFGRWHAVRVGLLLALAVILFGRVRAYSLELSGTRTLWWVMWGALSGGILITHSFSGHPSVSTPRAVALLSDVVHLGTAGIWFAGIVVLAVVVPDAWLGLSRNTRLDLLAPVVLRFSRLALVTVLIAGATGILNAFLNIGRFSDLWGTNYGLAVLGKLGLFGGILVLGAINHFILRARFEEARAEGTATKAQSIFRRTIATELAIALLILGLTGVLIGLQRTKDLPRSAGTSSVSP